MEELDRWVRLVVGAEDIDGFLVSIQKLLISILTKDSSCEQGHPLVRLVYVVHGDDGEVSIVAEVPQRNTSTRLDLAILDILLRHVKADGHAEQVAV